jgi:hypothetical protein
MFREKIREIYFRERSQSEPDIFPKVGLFSLNFKQNFV